MEEWGNNYGEQGQQMSTRDLIEQQKLEIMRRMGQMEDKSSQEYFNLSANLENLTRASANEAAAADHAASERNEIMASQEKHSWWAPILIPAGTNLLGQMIGTFVNRANVKTVVKEEDAGGIVKSQATQFLQKPRN